MDLFDCQLKPDGEWSKGDEESRPAQKWDLQSPEGFTGRLLFWAACSRTISLSVIRPADPSPWMSRLEGEKAVCVGGVTQVAQKRWRTGCPLEGDTLSVVRAVGGLSEH